MSGDKQSSKASPAFGGDWTEEKLEILEKYLRTYTTVLKKTEWFKLMYIDAFAGSGRIAFRGGSEARGFLDGSAARAMQIRDKEFDRLIFVEKKASRRAELRILRQEDHLRRCEEGLPRRDIDIIDAEANEFLRGFSADWKSWRGVLFLDPYGAGVNWDTIKTTSSFDALDTWILFPTSALARMLSKGKTPEDVNPNWAVRLTKVYGDNSWRELYHETTDLLGKKLRQRRPGVEGLLSIYKAKLRELFGDRFLEKSRTLTNSRNSPLFEFIFCAGHPAGAEIAHRIAEHIIDSP